MSKLEKLLARLKNKPTDFSWVEFEALMSMLDYKKVKSGKTGGSRRRYVHAQLRPFVIHEPHPQRVLKPYQVEDVIQQLKLEGIL
ncbi:MAG: type II toxin-antitoxin system HicA family toxin [bacterium]|nr:type II toxin-antitoxin system HicA family toxin [bacterium]